MKYCIIIIYRYHNHLHNFFNSFVRSVTMDSWDEKQVKMMRSGGNDNCNSFLGQYNIPKNMEIAMKYNTAG